MSDKVLITGISGWIAQHCAVELIKKGYFVKGSIRHKDREAEVRTVLEPFLASPDQLSFCYLDLLDDSGWDEAMQDCKYVLHVASPFVMEEPAYADELILPAKEGTLRALRSAQKAGVKRVVVTSSIAAMCAHMDKGEINSESWTNLESSKPNAYQRSKTIAEQAAWEFYYNQEGEHSIELSVINPGAVLGPALSPDLAGASLGFCAAMLLGKMPGIPNISFAMVDVRDVAFHHVQAMTIPEADGKRFISAGHHPESFLTVAKLLNDNGYSQVTLKNVPNFMIKTMALFNREARGMKSFLDTYITCDNSQTRHMFNWTPIELKKTVLDMGETVQSFLNR